MSAKMKLDDLQALRSAIEMGGGADEIKKQQQAGKMTARERLAALFDEGSFIEVGAFVKQRPTELDQAVEVSAEGVVTGYGAIDGRLCYAYAQDATVIGGALGEMHAAKITKIIDMAVKMGAPVVAVLDSNGARLAEGVDALQGYANIAAATAVASGVVPQIAVVAGLCAGGSAMIAANNDFVIMTEKAEMFLSAPVVLKAALGQDSTGVGTAQANAASGNVHLVAADDAQAIAMAKQLLLYLPSNNLEMAPVMENGDDINRMIPELNEMVTDEDTNMEAIITRVVDAGTYVELQKDYGTNVITAFARMNGDAVGIVANKGVMCSACAKKAARFVSVCDSYNIPVVTFTDLAGYAMSVEEENAGNVRAMGQLMGAYAAATCAKVNVIVKKAIGSAYAVMTAGSDVVMAWPTAEVGVMEAAAAVTILDNEKIKEGADKAALIEEYKNVLAAPYEAAKRGYIDDVIEPDSTRPRVIASLLMLQSKRVNLPSKKHTNLPL
ncbi:MAG: acyl-CoA carboxylase subunit beta [Eubacteriales bacterium]|jgi:acetyl-CoA carboxylase carboxyltransferase component